MVPLKVVAEEEMMEWGKGVLLVADAWVLQAGRPGLAMWHRGGRRVVLGCPGWGAATLTCCCSRWDTGPPPCKALSIPSALSAVPAPSCHPRSCAASPPSHPLRETPCLLGLAASLLPLLLLYELYKEGTEICYY